MSESPALLGFVRDTADRLALGLELPEEPLRQALDGLKETLAGYHARYQEPAPPGAESLQETMLEALELFYQSLEALEDYLATRDMDCLARAVVLAEEGDDLMLSLEDSIQQSHDWMSQFTLG
ncbi:MAG TPA: hypothetical protein VNO81_09110 [Candidatus Nitrosotenuis sp.]|jgi:hypothetical protein|nr:hypothetical protein [Candidatus Nitrosotenuis sp.]